MYTNESGALLRQGIDNKARLPTWEEVPIPQLYAECSIGQTIISNLNGAQEIIPADSIYISIPKQHVPDPMPKRGDRIRVAGRTYTIMSVVPCLYGSEAVQHIEVTAK